MDASTVRASFVLWWCPPHPALTPYRENLWEDAPSEVAIAATAKAGAEIPSSSGHLKPTDPV